MPPATVASVIEPTTSAYTTPFYLSETDRPNPSARTDGVIRTLVLSETNKYAVRRESTFVDSFS